jgi:EAL domain-containing protein (putative c-di-GMP-specific phosphodiesterase class I)
MGASVGVATLDAGGGQVAFRAADAALRAAKQAGKGCVRLAEGAQQAHDDVDLAAALAEGAVHLRFDSATAPDGSIAVVHAVPVWNHPANGPMRGPELWAAAERQGLTWQLQRWLVHQATAEVAALDDALTVAVSLSPGSAQPAGIAQLMSDALAASGLPAWRLMLSLTEETLLTSPATLATELEAVRATGVRLCLDNYGMGHSLFPLIDRVMLDAVRVDLSALTVRGSGLALQMLAAIVSTARAFGVSVIAGGIRTPELRDAAVGAGAQLLNGRALPHDLSGADVALAMAAPTPA